MFLENKEKEQTGGEKVIVRLHKGTGPVARQLADWREGQEQFDTGRAKGVWDWQGLPEPAYFANQELHHWEQ